MRSLRLLQAAVLVLAAAGAMAVAQDMGSAEKKAAPTIPDLLDKARAAAEAEDWDAVIVHCQGVIDLAQEKQGGILSRLFPKAPEGWRREDPDVSRLNLAAEGQSFANVNITCTYIKEAQPEEEEEEIAVEALVTNMQMAVQSMKNMLNIKENVAAMKMMGIDVFERDGFQCMKQSDPEQTESSEAAFYAFGDKAMLHVHGPAKQTGDVEKIFKLFELKKVLK